MGNDGTHRIEDLFEGMDMEEVSKKFIEDLCTFKDMEREVNNGTD